MDMSWYLVPEVRMHSSGGKSKEVDVWPRIVIESYGQTDEEMLTEDEMRSGIETRKVEPAIRKNDDIRS